MTETLIITTTVFTGIALLLAVYIMGMWQYRTKGAWHNYPTGRAVMGLLGVLAATLLLNLLTTLLGEFPGMYWIYTAVSLLLVAAMIRICWTFKQVHRNHE